MSAVDGWPWRCTRGRGRGGLARRRGVAGGGVPGDGDRLAGELERDDAFDGAGGAVAGLPGTEDLLAVFYRDLDGPSVGIAFDNLRGEGGGIGGDQGQVVPGLGLVADEHDGDRAGAEDRVPQAGESGRLDGHGLAVAGDGDLGERSGGGEPGERGVTARGERGASSGTPRCCRNSRTSPGWPAADRMPGDPG